MELKHDNNSFLEAAFTEGEVRNAIGSCDVSRSPGPDSFSFDFIKESWDLLKSKIMGMISEFHWNGRFSCGMNL